MNLNHLNLHVSDVAEARSFFVSHFDFRCVSEREGQIAIMEDDAGFSLAVSNLFDSPPTGYPSDFHVGFVLENESHLRAHYERLQEADVPMKGAPRRGGPNLYFVCLGPDSIPVEVSAPRSE